MKVRASCSASTVPLQAIKASDNMIYLSRCVFVGVVFVGVVVFPATPMSDYHRHGRQGGNPRKQFNRRCVATHAWLLYIHPYLHTYIHPYLAAIYCL